MPNSVDDHVEWLKSRPDTPIRPGDILFLYSDGVYDGSDEEQRNDLEQLMRDYHLLSAKDICNAVLEHAVRMDDRLRDTGEQDRIDDKTVFIIKRIAIDAGIDKN